MKFDYYYILLIKLIVENSRKRLINNDKIKYVCFVIYIMRNINFFYMFNKINFFLGWILVILDVIEKLIFVLLDLYNKFVFDVFGGNE